ncbi:PREDICTED: dof zinc finger protein DOF3.7-like isoform 2 [Fragaria vesca subsp. vesca]
MDTAQWPQEIGLEKTMEENMASDAARLASEKRARPQEQLNCPRRYWTEGGTLRNVPVGGGSRKNKKSTSSTASSSAISSSKNIIPDLNPPSLSHFSSQNPRMTHEGQDLNLAFSANVEHYSGTSTAHYVDHHQVPKMESNNSSALELLRSTGIASRGVNSYIPNSMQDSNAVLYSSSGFALQEFKPSQLGFCVDGLGSRYSDHPQENGGSGRLLFPFGDLKQISSTTTGHHELDQNKGQGNPTGYWNGLMGGGSW